MILQVAPIRVERHVIEPRSSGCGAKRLVRQQEVRRLARLRNADHGACERLIQEYSGRMHCVARRMLRSEEDAADAVQDAFLAAFAALHRFRAQAQIYTWLHRIVVNQCLMRLRSRKRRVMLSLDAFGSTDGDGACVFEAVAPSEDAATELDRFETRLGVRRAIQQLSAEYREILILRDIEEFDTDQTAAVLSLSRSATKTRLHRARQALRTALEQSDLCFA